MKITIDTNEVFQLGTTQAMMLGIFRQQPEITPKELKALLGLSDVGVYPNLKNLERSGYIAIYRKTDKKQSPIVEIEVLK